MWTTGNTGSPGHSDSNQFDFQGTPSNPDMGGVTDLDVPQAALEPMDRMMSQQCDLDGSPGVGHGGFVLGSGRPD